jgi:hypothetical protein
VPNDAGALGTINGIGAYSAVNSTTAPLFRSRIGSSSSRTFPAMNFILDNANVPANNEGEALPQVARTMNFRLTVRDNKTGGGGVDSEALVVTVTNNGPFEIISNNTTATIAAGASIPLTWNVNGTNAESANVKISMSIDGQSFPFVLLASTPNDGSELVTIPTNFPASTTARIKISSIGGNGFEWFDLNNANLTITSSCAAISSFICPTTTVSGNAGAAAFNLGLTSVVNDNFVGNSRVFNTAGAANLPVINYTDDTYTTCQASGWDSSAAVLVPFRITVSGSYVIGASAASFTGYSIFSSTTYNCTNFVGGNTNGAIGHNGSQAISLNECTTYYALLYNINSASPSITFSFTGPGDVFEVQTMPAGFSYTYAAINTTSQNIDAVSATSDFTGLAGGTFSVKGLMYANAVNPATFVGGTESAAFGTGSCILFSSNSKTLNIIGNPCPPSTTLVSTTNDISSLPAQVFQTSNTSGSGLITATNDITGGNVTYDAGKKVEMNPGFSVNANPGNTAVFLAKIGGCN